MGKELGGTIGGTITTRSIVCRLNLDRLYLWDENKKIDPDLLLRRSR